MIWYITIPKDYTRIFSIQAVVSTLTLATPKEPLDAGLPSEGLGSAR